MRSLREGEPGWGDVARHVIVLGSGPSTTVFGTYWSRAAAETAAFEGGLPVGGYVVAPVLDLETGEAEQAA